jgi:hypothetical protein
VTTTATVQRRSWCSNGQTRVSPTSRDRIALAARDVMRAALRHHPLASVSGRQREALMELAKPLVVLGEIVAEWPETEGLFEAWLRGRAIREPATLDECITALVTVDADEEKAKAAYLRRPCEETRREWARLLRLQAARSIELARVLEDGESRTDD